jgi:phage shock protein PspC (stress-responsive transcriptional regulator)
MEPTAAPADTPIRRLTRDHDNRMVGGVAGGLGRYFGIDPVIFRAAFVALAVVGGSGLALYLIGWLLVPEDGAERSIAADVLEGGEHRRPVVRILVVGLLVVAFFNLLVAGPWFGGPVGDPGVLIAALALASLFLVLITRRSTIGWAIGSVIGILVLMTALAVGSALLIVSNAGVSMHGGVGDRSWHPAVAADLRPAYRLGVGDLTVDLSQVELNEGITHVDATVGVGHLLVLVPADAAVTVAAHSGAGNAVVFGDEDSGLGADRFRSLPAPENTGAASEGTGRRLVIDASAGIGEVEVGRGR